MEQHFLMAFAPLIFATEWNVTMRNRVSTFVVQRAAKAGFTFSIGWSTLIGPRLTINSVPNTIAIRSSFYWNFGKLCLKFDVLIDDFKWSCFTCWGHCRKCQHEENCDDSWIHFCLIWNLVGCFSYKCARVELVEDWMNVSTWSQVLYKAILYHPFSFWANGIRDCRKVPASGEPVILEMSSSCWK